MNIFVIYTSEQHVYQHYFSLHTSIRASVLSTENTFIHSFIHWSIHWGSIHRETLAPLQQPVAGHQHSANNPETFSRWGPASRLHLQCLILPCDPGGCWKFPLCQRYVRLKSPCGTNWTNSLKGRLTWISFSRLASMVLTRSLLTRPTGFLSFVHWTDSVSKTAVQIRRYWLVKYATQLLFPFLHVETSEAITSGRGHHLHYRNSLFHLCLCVAVRSDTARVSFPECRAARQ